MSEAASRIGSWRASNELGFTLRFAALAATLLIVPWAVSLVALEGPLRYLVPGSAAGILSLVFVRRPAEALLGLALLVLFYDTTARWIGEPIKQTDELAIGLIAVVALFRVLPAWRSWIWLPRELAVLAAIGFALASSLAAAVPLATWAPALALFGKAIAFLYVVSWTSFRVWEIRAGLGIVLVIGLAVLALGFVELLAPSAFQQLMGLGDVPQRIGIPVIKSVFVHPALFGWFTAAVALFLFANYLVTARWRWLLLGLLFSIGPFLSARRRAILALGAGLAAALPDSLRRLRPGRQVVRLWGPLAASAALFVVVFLPALSSLYELTVERYVPPPVAVPSPAPGASPLPAATPVPTPAGGRDNPHARVALYRGSLEVARDYFPLGAGLGRYGSWMSRVDYSPLYEEYGLSGIWQLGPANPSAVTDTFWPMILGELGFFGLFAYGAFIAALGWMLWREAGRAEGPTMRLVTLGAGMLFAQGVVESLASAMYHSPPRVYLLYLAVGIVASVSWRRKLEPDEEQQLK